MEDQESELGKIIELIVDPALWLALCKNAAEPNHGSPKMAIATPGTRKVIHCDVLQVWDHRKVVVKVFAVI